MERFVIMQTKEGLWSASHDGETFATYLTEEETLAATLIRAAERRRVGIKTVVIVTREAQSEFPCRTIRHLD